MIKDSGERREFETGAVRDMAKGKGRFDLMPLDVIAQVMKDVFIFNLSQFQQSKNTKYIDGAIDALLAGKNKYEEMLKLALHFENGAIKYGERNWEKGLPADCYIDSAARHYHKYKSGWTDEPHYTACLWNLVALKWTFERQGVKNESEASE